MKNSTIPLDLVPDDIVDSGGVLENLPARSGITWAYYRQIYHVVSMSTSILGDATSVLGSLSKQASNLLYSHPEKIESGEFANADIAVVLGEALDCIDLATEYLAALNIAVRSRLEDEES